MPVLLPHLAVTVTWADEDLQELTVSAASELFSGQVSLYASPDELRDMAERLRAYLDGGRSSRREFALGQEDFAGYGTARVTVQRQEFGDSVGVEVVLRVNPTERLVSAESCVLRFPVQVTDLERFESDLRRIAQRLGSRASIGQPDGASARPLQRSLA